MIIANPIYDVAFKLIMDNNRVAKFFIGMILNCEILELKATVIEHPQRDNKTGKATLMRMDFAATIKTDDGEKQVIIEMQKALQLGDVFRFRKYLGKEYVSSKLPIISIYILGFDLSVDSPAFVALRDCRDLRTNEKLEVNDLFVEHLTHNAYFIQTLRIKPSYNTRLEKLLSVFEQANFIEGTGTTTKDLELDEDDPQLKELVGILSYAAADKKTRKKLDEEAYYLEAMDEMFGAKDRELAKTKKDLEKSNKDLEKKNQALINTAAELKRDGMTIKKIAKLTGITVEEIKKL